VSALFTYGTLRDPEYQAALFDRPLPMRPATLAGWRVVVAESGYLTIVRAPGERIAGDLVELDAADLVRADGWEGPEYARSAVVAQAGNGTEIACEVYVKPTASREPPPAGAVAGHAREHVLAQILAFRACHGELVEPAPRSLSLDKLGMRVFLRAREQ
jgi:gamma-glutamylcyclotransferase (GGCT)/AIG2-like uncharacterized protein YtfP